jgi:hypothetical protein
MTTRRTITRTIRLAVGTAAVLALMSSAAQAKPLEPITTVQHVSPIHLVRKGTYMPIPPANPSSRVAFTRAHGDAINPAQLAQVSRTQSVALRTSADGFDWIAAIGAGSVLAVLIAGVSLTGRGRRRVPVSA